MLNIDDQYLIHWLMVHLNIFFFLNKISSKGRLRGFPGAILCHFPASNETYWLWFQSGSHNNDTRLVWNSLKQELLNRPWINCQQLLLGEAHIQKGMDAEGEGSTAGGRLSPTLSEGVPVTVQSGDQVWLEELIGPLFCQSSSSPGGPSYSAGGSRSSSENSWSSGATSVQRSSIKNQSQEAFQSRLRVGGCWKKLACPSLGPHVANANPQVEQRGGTSKILLHAWMERVGLSNGRYSAQTGSCSGVQLQRLLEEKIEAKLRFSKFVDEVTSNLFDTNSLQAFRKPVSRCRFIAKGATRPEEKIEELTEWGPGVLSSVAMQEACSPEEKMPKEEHTFPHPQQKTYLETDIDMVRTAGKLHNPAVRAETLGQQETDGGHIIPPPPQFCQGFQMNSPFPEFHCHFPRYPYKSVSLPRGINMVSNETLPSL